MFLDKLLKKKHSYIGIDIGSSGIKLIEIEGAQSGNPRLKNLSYIPLTGDIFSNNVITSQDKVSGAVTDMFQGMSVEGKKIVASVPGSGIFTKRIKTPDLDSEDLFSHIELEAGNFIPQGTKTVSLDYHIIGRASKNQLDVQVVATKTDVVDSFLDTFLKTGLDLAILDVDQCAIQNMFELSYPELVNNVVALLHVGARYTSIVVCKAGIPLFYGDLSIGGKSLTESIQEIKGINFEEAEKLKKQSPSAVETMDPAVREVIHQGVEVIGSDLSKQLTYLWNSGGNGEGIDQIFISGGTSQLPKLAEDIATRTGIETSVIDPFRKIQHDATFQKEYLQEMAPYFGVAVGLGIRYFRDRIMPESV